MPIVNVQNSSVRLIVTSIEDFDALAKLRIEAMRESLERVGRFDAQRARERLASGFVPDSTRHIVVGEERVGFVAVKRTTEGLHLEHLYIRPQHQGLGIGASVLGKIFAEADADRLPLRVTALRGSDSNRFYVRHGFAPVAESDWDVHYVRPALAARGRSGTPE